jgi:S-DNA-T family DNA segregation ATPase FtsK/SpoIIIE
MRFGKFELDQFQPETNLQTLVSATTFGGVGFLFGIGGATPALSFGAATLSLGTLWLLRQAATAWKRDNCLMGSDLDDIDTRDITPINTEITDTLSDYGLPNAKPYKSLHGPVLTRHLITLPRGTTLGKLPDEDIARDLGVESVTIGKNAGRGLISLDVPRDDRQIVDFATLMQSKAWADAKASDMKLPVCLGVDVVGNPAIVDLRDAVHLFIAGTTGSGKSVMANAILLSLMQSGRKFHLMIGDGKGEDLAPYYAKSKHLIVATDVTAIETEVDGIAHQIRWLVEEMDRRFKGESDKTIPIICTIDELADVLGLGDKDMEAGLQRLSQKSRSANIHMLPCTQSPNSEIFSQTFRANIPSAIGLRTKTAAQSKVAIQEIGCEKLLGDGDAYASIKGKITRVHGANITNSELKEYMQ